MSTLSKSLTLLFLCCTLHTLGEKGKAKGKGKATTLEPTDSPITTTTNTPRPTNNPTSNPITTTTSPITTSPTLSPTLAPTEGSCLASPDSLEWTEIDGVYYATLDYEVSTHIWDIDGNETILTARNYNGAIPSPSIRMTRGKRYLLTVNNTLDPETTSNPTTANTFKDPSTTNIHTHGLHISGDNNADNVFTMISPGANHTYDYRIPCDHSAGTHWYHPHHHGSTALQVGSGAAGFLFIENDDPETTEGYPEWLVDLDDDSLDLIIQHFDLEFITSLWETSDPLVDEVTSYSGASDFTLVNGEYQPTICLTSGEWRRLNMLYVDTSHSIEMTIVNQYNDSINECRLELIARDGVLVHGENNETPRSITNMTFSGASRNDIAITCDPGTYLLKGDSSTTLAYITVSGNTFASEVDDLTIFNPIRPTYLQSLLNETNETSADYNTYEIEMGRGTINNIKFNHSETSYLETFIADTIQEWTITGSDRHPYHQHVYHFQLQENGVGNDRRGDWIDALNTENIIKFRTDTFGGKMIVHCHILDHEDTGMMVLFKIDGGCDYDYTSFNGESPACSKSWPCSS